MSAIYTGGFMAQEDTAKGMSMVQRPMNGGVQRQYKFSNGYGASVIKNPGSYGYEQDLWEIAPWVSATHEFIGREIMDWDDDVKGYLDEGELVYYLEKIRCLPTPI